MNVTVPLTLLPAVGCSTEMPFDDVADFAAGVCASAIKPANDASASPMKEALSEFMSAFVFRTSRHVQSHQCSHKRKFRCAFGRRAFGQCHSSRRNSSDLERRGK